jgi:hypothetical protein
VSWDRPFDQPVPLPKGAPARTLRDAAAFIRKLPRSEQEVTEWQEAAKMLINAAENRGPTMFAKMAIRQAIHRRQRAFNPSRQEPAHLERNQ